MDKGIRYMCIFVIVLLFIYYCKKTNSLIERFTENVKTLDSPSILLSSDDLSTIEMVWGIGIKGPDGDDLASSQKNLGVRLKDEGDCREVDDNNGNRVCEINQHHKIKEHKKKDVMAWISSNQNLVDKCKIACLNNSDCTHFQVTLKENNTNGYNARDNSMSELGSDPEHSVCSLFKLPEGVADDPKNWKSNEKEVDDSTYGTREVAFEVKKKTNEKCNTEDCREVGGSCSAGCVPKVSGDYDPHTCTAQEADTVTPFIHAAPAGYRAQDGTWLRVPTCETTSVDACAAATTDQGTCEAAGPCSFTAVGSTTAFEAARCTTTPVEACAAATTDQGTCEAAGSCSFTAVGSTTAFVAASCTTTPVEACAAAADQGTCEAAGSCTWSAGDSTCATTDQDAACGTAATDQATCEAAGTAAGDCTWTAEVPAEPATASCDVIDQDTACNAAVQGAAGATAQAACEAAGTTAGDCTYRAEVAAAPATASCAVTNEARLACNAAVADQATCEAAGDCTYSAEVGVCTLDGIDEDPSCVQAGGTWVTKYCADDGKYKHSVDVCDDETALLDGPFCAAVDYPISQEQCVALNEPGFCSDNDTTDPNECLKKSTGNSWRTTDSVCPLDDIDCGDDDNPSGTGYTHIQGGEDKCVAKESDFASLGDVCSSEQDKEVCEEGGCRWTPDPAGPGTCSAIPWTASAGVFGGASITHPESGGAEKCRDKRATYVPGYCKKTGTDSFLPYNINEVSCEAPPHNGEWVEAQCEYTKQEDVFCYEAPASEGKCGRENKYYSDPNECKYHTWTAVDEDYCKTPNEAGKCKKKCEFTFREDLNELARTCKPEPEPTCNFILGADNAQSLCEDGENLCTYEQATCDHPDICSDGWERKSGSTNCANAICTVAECCQPTTTTPAATATPTTPAATATPTTPAATATPTTPAATTTPTSSPYINYIIFFVVFLILVGMAFMFRGMKP